MSAAKNPWNSLMESLHSAMIDELTERHPKPKPTLGMPLRFNAFALPPAAERWIHCEALIDGGKGFALLAFQQGFFKKLKVDAQGFWAAMLKRSEIEFPRRGIAPLLSSATEIDAQGKHVVTATRAIWIPMEIPDGTAWLGIAI